jgi:tetratricopeptide (TPR) repeat protein
MTPMRNFLLLAGAIVAAGIAGPRLAAADDAPRKGLYQRTLSATAWVLIPRGGHSGLASGWVLDVPRRLLVTNYHVVGNSDKVLVVFPMYQGGKLVAEKSANLDKGRRIRGTVLDSDPKRDLALIELESLPPEVTALKLAADSASPGDRVHSVGNPGTSDALWIYTSGTVRQVYHKRYHIDGQPVEARVVETQAPINPGDSGGPVVNDDGELVGVTSATNLAAQLVSICIDVSEVRAFQAEANRLVTPRTAEDYVRRGRHYSGRGRTDRAIADFTEAMRLKPDLVAAYTGRAACFHAKGDYVTAIADFGEALRLKPGDAEALRGRGQAYLRKGDADKAIADASEAIRLNALDGAAHNLRGLAHDLKKEHAEAVGDYSQAIRINPHDAQAYHYRGDSQRVRGQLDKALEDFNESIRLNPNNPHVYRLRGEVYRLKNQLDLALVDCNKALQLLPNSVLFLRDRAVTYKMRKEYDRAIADCDQALRLNPKDAIAYNLRGASYSFKNDWDRAIGDYSEAIKLNPRFAMAWKNRGQAYEAKGNTEMARRDFEEAARIDPALKPASKK